MPQAAWADGADELLDTLPPHEREAVRLRVLEDLEYSDIARAIGTTPAAARVRVHRGLKALKRHRSRPRRTNHHPLDFDPDLERLGRGPGRQHHHRPRPRAPSCTRQSDRAASSPCAAPAPSGGQHARARGCRRGARAHPGRVVGPAGVRRYEGERRLGVGAVELRHGPEPSPGEPEARRIGDARADRDRDGDRPSTHQPPGDLYPGAGRGKHVGATGEGSRGHERHGDHQPGRVGWQHGPGHLPPGLLRRVPGEHESVDAPRVFGQQLIR